MPETTDVVTSVRIVSVDYYLTPPVPKLDVTYSEFRGATVKRVSFSSWPVPWPPVTHTSVVQVPTVRIFGSTADGEKVCAHVHGVFPYLYIPMDETTRESDAAQFAYQITHSLDKALSVTQGRVSSTAQHVFKAVPVRGKPFYGYHAKDHLFLKVYFYNPTMVKRAANLLQNGAICGRVFQAHESHVPYILQFFIDYNLYGMSFLHVNSDTVRYRDEEDAGVPRMATTRVEMDLQASEILNRTRLRVSGSEHQNPGIAAIWEDELRRRKSMSEEDLPPIEVPESQERPFASVTETDRRFREILRRKLMREDADGSVLDTGNSVQSGRKFDLSILLNNSVYPASCPKDMRLPEASMVPDHVSGRESTFSPIKESEKSFLESSLVDESVVLSLERRSQSRDETLDEEDLKLLAIMEQLEEGDDREIDLDSTLAPLSQSSQRSMSVQLIKLTQSQEKCDRVENLDDLADEFDEDLLNVFNETMDGVIPQLDGEHEMQKQSPTRLLKKRRSSFTKESSRKSTRSPRKNIYSPLNIIITSPSSASKRKRSSDSVTPVKFKSILKTPSSSAGPPNGHASDPPKKKLKFNNIVIVNGCLRQSLDVTPKRSHKDLDVKRALNERLEFSPPKNYANLMEKHGIKDCSVLLTRVDISDVVDSSEKKPEMESSTVKSDLTDEFKDIINKSPVVSVERLAMGDISKLSNGEEEEEEEEEVKEKSCEKKRSSNDKAHMYDVEHNFFPIAGPSNVNYYRASDIPTEYYGGVIDGQEMEDDDGMTSFYDLTMCVDSTDDELSAFAREQEAILTDVMASESVDETADNVVVKIYPMPSPPHPDTVRETMHEYGIEEFSYPQPFFSDPVDQSGRREVGQMVLQVKGNTLSICEEFISCLEDLEGLSKWRQKKFQTEMGEFVDDREKVNIREFMATEKEETIEPQDAPPSVSEARTWLRVREKVSGRITMESVDVDSPVKVKREKQKMIGDIEECNGKARCSLSFQSDPFGGQESQVIEASPSSLDVLMKTDEKSSLKQRLSYANRRQTRSCRLKARLRNGHRVSCDSTNSSISDKLISELMERKSYLKTLNLSSDSPDHDVSSIDGTFGFKQDVGNMRSAKACVEYNFLTVFSLECHVLTRGDLCPNPDFDGIVAIFYAVQNNVPADDRRPSHVSGVIIDDMFSKDVGLRHSGVEINAIHAEDEKQVLEKLIELIKFWDPDIFLGYEIEMHSWGYIIERGFVLGLNMPNALSRLRVNAEEVRRTDEEKDDGVEYESELKIPGRIILDVWRLLREEIALMSYSFESIAYHILHRRYPKRSYRDLTKLWNSSRTRWIVLQYFLLRARGTLEILDQLDLLGRTSEMAKLFGIQFFEVLSRGSQFRVESMMLRMAKPRNFISVSPSIQQRAHMRAPEYLPLILEPESRLYVDPVIVLDFQSLYPSMMMGYNYCFSTCLGRVEHLGESDPFEFGANQLKITPEQVKKFLQRDLITISPCGVVFVKSQVREGVLPRMLKEILDTRFMVKKAMKIHSAPSLQRILHSRQLGLKLMANVTYGYTAANFSGRMPCVEVGDSVVSKGRETLQRAIALVEANEKWRVRVVYGDTDSLFVLVPGRSREEAFRIGNEIVDAVTQDNPKPVKLKLEKVYQPCILQTKKRYVGYMYESPGQKEPVYEAKGIETVRRDGCPIVAKMLEKCLKILFETRDVSIIKRYTLRQFTKILSGKGNVQELVFAKEFRGVNGYKAGACVPALELTRKWKQSDPRMEPRKGERVPYVIVNGPPGLPLIKLVRSPKDLLMDEGLKINAFYYIQKVIIPPLNRCLLLIGVDVNDWFTNMPRTAAFLPTIVSESRTSAIGEAKKSTISQYFATRSCAAGCGNQTSDGICVNCVRIHPQKTLLTIYNRISTLERKYCGVMKICQMCCGNDRETDCSSLDCPVLFVRTQAWRERKHVDFAMRALDNRM
ncbi:DNA polymerase zeta catalytic subunit [Phlebotomus argentipes]|uniref:DNA polymerase zeta catalytic subunit n=1 Tax=Phlebotomus argentipes TaxID=94469 RepID=UPI002892D9D8|nr:DNA polymerase zeta catalytic subunit [Phlebotomus argentipes]